MTRPAPRPKMHELKTDPEPFAKTKKGRKPLELRRDDRDFQPGDYLLLREWKDGDYTGDTQVCYVLSVIRHGDTYGEMLAPGHVAMGILPFKRPRSI